MKRFGGGQKHLIIAQSQFRKQADEVMLTKGSHMFAGPDRLEANERHLHAGQRSDGIPRRISHIETAGETTHKDQDQSVKWNHVRDESVSTWRPSWSIRVYFELIKLAPQAATM